MSDVFVELGFDCSLFNNRLGNVFNNPWEDFNSYKFANKYRTV